MWNKLSMADRAKYIQLGVQNGVTDLNAIKKVYNTYAGGGFLNWLFGDSESTEKETLKSDTNRFVRIRPNDSKTSIESTKLEDDVARRQQSMLSAASRNGAPSSSDYYIPYSGQELTLPGVGRVSSNTLDSIAVNAERAGISLGDALGLASYETKFGASPNMSVDGFKKSYKKKYGKEPTKEKVKQFERQSLNASYMRNHGGIYPQYLVNDHEWSDRGWEQSPKYKNKLKGISSPLQHAFTIYKLGIYNTGDPNHTSNIHKEGERLLRLPVIKGWQKDYNSKKSNKKK